MLTICAQIFFLAAVTTRDQGRILIWATIGACVGVYLFSRGFKMLQFKRLILNTPLSKVRSASMGLVELSGIAVGPNMIPAGITGDPCYYYRATAWEYQRSGNRSEWKRVADESLFVPFFLQDDTGRLLVNAQGADMDLHRNFKDEFGSSFSSSNELPMGAPKDFLLRYGISGRHVRLEEYCIKPDYPLFVFGTLGENFVRARSVPEKHVTSISSSINFRLNSRPMGNGLPQMLSGLPGVQMNLDNSPSSLRAGAADPATPRATQAPVPQPSATSAWSDISMNEVHKPVLEARVASAVSVMQMPEPQNAASSWPAQSMSASSEDLPPLDATTNSGFALNAPTAVGKGSSTSPFTISSESQRELVSSLGWKSTACIWGGPALAVACVYILLVTLGWM
jgi:hypothetical protein